MKIGIPHSLLYYYYFPFWDKLFTELGHEVVVSESTNKGIVDMATKISVPELCVPIKLYNGHIARLLEMDVDLIYVHWFVSIKKDETFCPKFIGLYDMVKYTFKQDRDKFISNPIEMESDILNSFKSYQCLLEPLGVTKKQMKQALKVASEYWYKFREISKRGYFLKDALKLVKNKELPAPRVQEGDISIGIMGYVYDVYDDYVGMKIVERLSEMGVKVTCFEMMDERILDNELKDLRKNLFWTFSNKLYGAGLNFSKDPFIDGIIHVTAFSCGPDSMLGKIMELDQGKYKKPFMTIRVDEHSGESHLQTRIEAFVDMIRKKKRGRL